MKRKGTTLLVAVLLLALLTYGCVTLDAVTRRLRDAETRLTELKADETALATENAALRYDIDHAEDAETIESIARERLGLVMPGETIYINNGN